MIFILDNVLTPKEGLDVIGNDTQVAFSIAQESVTLLSPSIESLGLSHPGSTEQIVFITDSYSIKQCPDCSPVENIGVNDLSYAVDELYGLEGAGLISRRNLFSYSFADLNEALNEETGGNQLQSQLRSSTWVIFCMSQPDESRPESLALQRLLSERADWLQGKNVIVFAFNAPYYLDITDISKLTAYYALYSKQDAFVEVAARVLFSELPPAGASPVSVPGITYNLSTILSADPEQTISLRVWKLDPDQEEELIPAEFSTELTGLEVGDHIKVQTSVILDHNGNPVPDNTPVLLVIQTQENEEVNQEYIQSETRNGIVEFDLVIQTGGPTYLQTQMLSGDTELDSSVVILDVFPQEQVMTPTPTNTPEPPQIQPSLTPDMLLTMTPGVGIIQQDEYTTTIAEWLVGLLVSLAAGVTVFQIGALTNRLRWRGALGIDNRPGRSAGGYVFCLCASRK